MKTNTRPTRLLATLFAGAALVGFASHTRAGTFSTDFDAGVPVGATLNGAALGYDMSSGGVSNTPCLQLTQNVGSQTSWLVLDDFDGGQPIRSLDATWKMYIGGNGTATPADGVSFVYGVFTPNPPAAFAEEGPAVGAMHGLTISFDTFNNGNNEAPAIDLKWDGNTVRTTVVPITTLIPTVNTTNTNYLTVHVSVSASGNVNVDYNGQVIYTNVTIYTPMLGAQFGFGARTGGSFENCFIDNLSITTTVATTPYVLSSTPTGTNGPASGTVRVVIADGVTHVNTNSSSLQLVYNGAGVTPNVAQPGDGTTVITYTPPPLLAVGSTNTFSVIYGDDGTPQTISTNTYSFVVGPYTTIPASYAVTGVDTAQPGFKMRVYQTGLTPAGGATRVPGDGNFTYNAERSLALGFLDPNNPGQPYANGADLTAATNNGYFVIPDFINLNTAAGGGLDIGNFQDISTPSFPDQPVPGITIGVNDAWYVTETEMYLQLKAGFYRFGVNSDDGFRFSTAPAAGDVLGITLGQFSGGRGSSDTTFDVVVPQDGVFPFRLAYWQGTGGANVELFTTDLAAGKKYLVNDAVNPATPILAYHESTVTRPYVARVLPVAGHPWALADDNILVELVDGTIPVNSGSISLTVNGQAVNNITKTGTTNTILRAGSVANLLPPGQNNLTLIYSYTEQANTVSITNNWSFSVVPYGVIPAGNKVPLAQITTTDIGFKARVNQIDRSGDASQGNGARLPNVGDQNRMPRPEMQLFGGDINPTNGTAYPNLADLTAADVNGIFDITDPLNFNSNPAGGNTGIFQGATDLPMPGLPGGGSSVTGGIKGIENYVGEFTTYLDLKAGVYLWAVNSDDGFVAISAPDPHDTLGTLLGYANVGRGNANPLPSPGAPNSYIPTPGTSQNNFAFGVVVPEDGIYPMRLLYWQGGGGVNLEFLSIDRNSGIQSLVNNTANDSLSIPAYRTYTGPARPWVKFSVSPTPWDNRVQQAGPGLIKAYGRTVANTGGNDLVNDADTRRPWADVGIGGVVANGVGDASLGLLVNGAPVTPTFTTNGSDVTVSYRPNPPLPAGSTNTAGLIYGGTTNSWKFIVQTYTNLNASDAIPASQADPGSVGFRVKMTEVASIPAGFTQNSAARAEAQLAGTLGLPDISLPGPGPNGTYIYTNILNWNNNVNPNHTGVQLGNFQRNVYGAGWPYGDHPDEPIPGVPNTTTNSANAFTYDLAAEIFAYLNFPTAGYYRFGVNSDDGFKLQVGTPGQTNGTVIFTTDVGKGASDIPFSFTVPQAGLYPMRLVYYNGGGGAALEFFSYDDTGNKIAINDSTNPNAIKAYYSLTSVGQLQFTSVTASGGNLTLNWSSTGAVTLQHATALTGNPNDWSDIVTNTSVNTLTLPVGPGNEFFRLKQ